MSEPESVSPDESGAGPPITASAFQAIPFDAQIRAIPPSPAKLLMPQQVNIYWRGGLNALSQHLSQRSYSMKTVLTRSILTLTLSAALLAPLRAENPAKTPDVKVDPAPVTTQAGILTS